MARINGVTTQYLTLEEKKNVQVGEVYKITGYGNWDEHPFEEGGTYTIAGIYDRQAGDFGFDFKAEDGYVFVAGNKFDVQNDGFKMERVV